MDGVERVVDWVTIYFTVHPDPGDKNKVDAKYMLYFKVKGN